MSRFSNGPARFLVFIILASGINGVTSGCATTPQAAPPTATVQAVPTATPSPTIVPTPQPAPQVFTVGNTGGLGAYLRRSPKGDKIKAWPDGAVMTAIGGDQIVDGTTWRNVRDPDGNEGWMSADYLVPQS